MSIERYQWAANREGGQTYGNQEEIRPLTREDFELYVKDKVTPWDFEAYIEKYPDTHISLVRQDNRGNWRLNRAGSLMELRPSAAARRAGWVKRVTEFSSPLAVKHGQSAGTVKRKLRKGGTLSR